MLSKPILTYRGPLSFSTIEWLLSEFKRAAQDHDISFRTYKKMISVMIEALENISKYSDQFTCEMEEGSGFCPSCHITRSEEGLELETKNPVRKEDVMTIKKRIDMVNQHDRDALKSLYKEIITNGEFSEKGGAGLGFIEMAKTANNKLEYKFDQLSPEYSLYTFRVRMAV